MTTTDPTKPQALAATAPETGLSATETAEPDPERVQGPPPWVRLADGLQNRGLATWEAGTQAHVDAALAEIGQLRVELAALRAEREWLADRARMMGIADVIIATYGPAHAVSAEVGRLRAEVKRLSARVREWEAVNADLLAAEVGADG